MKKTAIQVVAEMYDESRAGMSHIPAARSSEREMGYRSALRDVIERLKKEPLEEPEVAAVRDFIDRLHVMGDWLVEETGKHTCGTGPDGHYGLHEPGCGYEPITPLAQIRIEMR